MNESRENTERRKETIDHHVKELPPAVNGH
jgi:hypothetical protein